MLTVTCLVVFSFNIRLHLEKKQLYTQSISLNREPSLDPLTYPPVDFGIGRTYPLERPLILQRPEPELPVESVKPEVQDRSPQALLLEGEEKFNSRLLNIQEGIKTLKRNTEQEAIISRETTNVWLSRIVEHIPTNVKLILVSQDPPTPDKLKDLAQSNTTDARVLIQCSEVCRKRKPGEKTVYVYVSSASNYPGGLTFRKRNILLLSVEPHDEGLKRKIKDLGLSLERQFRTLFIVPFENNFSNVRDIRALLILTRLLLMIWLGAISRELKSKTKHLVPQEQEIQYIGLATDNPLLIDINKSNKPNRSSKRRIKRRVKRKSEKKSLEQVED